MRPRIPVITGRDEVTFPSGRVSEGRDDATEAQLLALVEAVAFPEREATYLILDAEGHKVPDGTAPVRDAVESGRSFMVEVARNVLPLGLEESKTPPYQVIVKEDEY